MARIICLSLIFIFFYVDKLISKEQDSLFLKSDTLNIISKKDTAFEDSNSLYQNVSPDDADTKRGKKIEVVRRNFSYRTQIGTALFMMGLVVIILTSVDNLNPN